jgi:hypothetical protein
MAAGMGLDRMPDASHTAGNRLVFDLQNSIYLQYTEGSNISSNGFTSQKSSTEHTSTKKEPHFTLCIPQ